MEILLVKADSAYANQMKKRMGQYGHHLDVAESLGEAMSLCSSNEYALVFVDLDQAQKSGNDVIGKLRAHLPDCRIVGMTKENSRSLELSARRQGVIFYMVQPADDKYAETIVQYVSDQLNQQREE